MSDEHVPLRIPAEPPAEWIRYIEEQERKKREEESGKNKTSSTGSVIIIDL